MNDSSAGQPHDQDNPFAAPQVDATALPSDPTISDAERVRCEYIAHEVSLKSSGLLYYIGGGLCGIYSLWLVCFGLSEAVNPRETEFTFGAATVFFGAIAVALIVIGRGLRKLKPWIRIPVGIVSVLGLLGFP